tara:strand:+ start:698 stop:1117 length:420 start_codon:yes stop_codon:yes gene_type:complete
MIAIVLSNFNQKVTDGLLNGCIKALDKNGIGKDKLSINRVPGAFEIPFKVNKILQSKKKYDAIITLGAIIKGETDHYHFISEAVTNAIMNISAKTTTPVLYGVITCQNKVLAFSRSGNNMNDNKGFEVGKAAIDVIRNC